MNQEAQIDWGWKKSIHISFRAQAEFQSDKSFNPSPPSYFVFVTLSQDTFVEFPANVLPFHRNLEQKEFISEMRPFGTMNVLAQKLVMPAMTEESNWSLPVEKKEEIL